jgi:hypothetical protein
MDWRWVIAIAALLALFILCVYLLRGRYKQAFNFLRLELRALKAEAEAERLEIQKGKEVALAVVEKEHEEAIAKLDDAEKKTAEELKTDPPRLSAFLVKAGKRK